MATNEIGRELSDHTRLLSKAQYLRYIGLDIALDIHGHEMHGLDADTEKIISKIMDTARLFSAFIDGVED